MCADDYLKEQRKALEESVAFFAPERKVEREKWVVDAFLKNLGMTFSDSELEPVADEPPDFRFRGAEFELKELMDIGRPRHQEYRNALEKANAATDPADLLEPFRPRDITVGEVHRRILDAASELLNKYAPSTCRNLDLLFYVNLENVMGLIEAPFPDVTSLGGQLWRSVSFILGYRACVLVARADAPSFLVEASGKIVQREIDSP